MFLFVFLCALGFVAANDNCTICLRGQCYSPTELNFEDYGMTVLYNAEMDYKNNIIYHLLPYKYKLNGTQLDNMTSISIPTADPYWPMSTLAVDAVTGEVYYNYRCLVYKYEPKTNTTTKLDFSCTNDKAPTHIWAANGTVFIQSGNGLSYLTSNGSLIEIVGLNGIYVFNVVMDKSGALYAQTRPKIYRIEGNAVTTVFTGSFYKFTPPMSLGGDGEVYFYDHFFIYNINSETKEVTKVGAKMSGYGSWRFDKHNNIIVDDTNLGAPLRYFKPNRMRCEVIRSVRYYGPEIVIRETEGEN